VKPWPVCCGQATPPASATADLIEPIDLAVAQLPVDGRPVLVRSDSAGGSGKLAWHLRERGIGFTLGMQIDAHVREAILASPPRPGRPRWTLTGRPGMVPRSVT
jgi:hypothetical protein